jgi:hypothetical protein
MHAGWRTNACVHGHVLVPFWSLECCTSACAHLVSCAFCFLQTASSLCLVSVSVFCVCVACLRFAFAFSDHNRAGQAGAGAGSSVLEVHNVPRGIQAGQAGGGTEACGGLGTTSVWVGVGQGATRAGYAVSACPLCCDTAWGGRVCFERLARCAVMHSGGCGLGRR